jgi:anti-sigma B factor antagonist
MPEPPPRPGAVLPTGTTAVITCTGSEVELTRRVTASVDRGARHVVVDLGDAEMVDSSTLHALKRLAGRLRSRGGRLSVVCPHPGLASLLDLTLLSRSFAVFGTLDAALRTTAP